MTIKEIHSFIYSLIDSKYIDFIMCQVLFQALEIP